MLIQNNWCNFTTKCCEGDHRLAPKSRDGILEDATVQRLTSTTHNKETAWVKVTKHAKEKEEDEEAIPVQKLVRPELNQFTQEKPVFPGSSTDLSLCIPLELSDEDRVPYTINRYLRDYQREGIRFIYNNYIHSTGCILGDDMGLGKTVQVHSTSWKIMARFVKIRICFLFGIVCLP